MNEKIESLKGKLIVSCQALPHEPLHSSFIMGRMALAAKEGGAYGIRANTKEDIAEIQTQVDLPVIGIVKRDYEDSKVYITPTMREINELMEVKPDIIALDATHSLRPGGRTLDEFYREIRNSYTDQSKSLKIESNDFEIIRQIVAKVKHRVIAEGNINTPEKARRVIELGAFSVVVGSIITRPQLITKSFAEALD